MLLCSISTGGILVFRLGNSRLSELWSTHVSGSPGKRAALGCPPIPNRHIEGRFFSVTVCYKDIDVLITCLRHMVPAGARLGHALHLRVLQQVVYVS